MEGFFFTHLLGVGLKRATREGAIAGMLTGLAAGTAYLPVFITPSCNKLHETLEK